MALSRAETTMSQIVTGLQLIVAGATYRTSPQQVLRTIRHIDDIHAFPEIGVEFGQEIITADDSGWRNMNADIDVVVQAAIQYPFDTTDERLAQYQACEEMLHDLKQALDTLKKQYITDATNPWFVLNDPGITYYRIRNISRPDEKTGELIHKDKGVVGSALKIRIKNLTTTFA